MNGNPVLQRLLGRLFDGKAKVYAGAKRGLGLLVEVVLACALCEFLLRPEGLQGGMKKKIERTRGKSKRCVR